MNKQTITQQWDHLRQVNGITLRLIASLPADKLDSTPIPNMRTPKELVVHMYNDVVKALTDGIVKGDLAYDTTRTIEKQIANSIKSTDELLKYVRDSWTIADRTVASITDAQLTREVKTPFGKNFPGSTIFAMIGDEYFHHRGQLYAYARALGVEPPMIWDFANNEQAFQPKPQTATV